MLINSQKDISHAISALSNVMGVVSKRKHLKLSFCTMNSDLFTILNSYKNVCTRTKQRKECRRKVLENFLSIFEFETSYMSLCGHEDDEYGSKWIEISEGDKTRNSSGSLSVVLFKMTSSTSSCICQRLYFSMNRGTMEYTGKVGK